MNLYSIIEEIEKVDADVYERLSPRRNALKSFTSFGSKVAMAAIPLALGSVFKKAYGQTTSLSKVLDVFQFALTLEYLEADFYDKALNLNPLLVPSGAPRGAITTIYNHEAAHVKFLQDTIKQLGSTPGSKPVFNYIRNFPDVFTNYDTFLAVSQAFEDTGVRAYKGQAGNLMGFSAADVLTPALNIHSVEARHASHIRQMRKARGAAVKPWITGNDTGGIGAAVQAIYNGEDLDTQAGVKITGINGMSISSAAATEAFDEPLTKEQVLAIVTPFIA